MSNPFLEATELTYDQVSWYRKRWFVIITLFLFTPATILLASTGDLYAQKDDSVYKFSKKYRMLLVLISIMLSVQGILRVMR